MFPSRVEIIAKGYFFVEKAREKKAKSFGKIEANIYVAEGKVDDGDKKILFF